MAGLIKEKLPQVSTTGWIIAIEKANTWLVMMFTFEDMLSEPIQKLGTPPMLWIHLKTTLFLKDRLLLSGQKASHDF